MRGVNRDTLVAIFLLLACGAFFAASFDIRETSYESLGSDVWPRAILLAIFALSLGLLGQSLRRPKAEVAGVAASGGLKGWLATYRNALWCYLLFGVYLLALPWLGMLLGGGLFVFLMLAALGPRDLRAQAGHLAVAVISVGAMWSIFRYGLKVMLPEGELFYGW